MKEILKQKLPYIVIGLIVVIVLVLVLMLIPKEQDKETKVDTTEEKSTSAVSIEKTKTEKNTEKGVVSNSVTVSKEKTKDEDGEGKVGITSTKSDSVNVQGTGEKKIESIEDEAIVRAAQTAAKLKNMDFEKISKAAADKGHKLAPNDRDLRRWVIRLSIYSQVQGLEAKDNDILSSAKIALERRNAFFKYTEKEYKVTIPKKELDSYIKSQAKNTEETKATAKGLQMTVEALNYEYERDQYQQQMIWKRIVPALKLKYPKKEGENDTDHINRLDTEFNKELDGFLKK